MSTLAQRTQRIMSLGLLLVIMPGVQTFGSELRGDLRFVIIGGFVACRCG